MKKIKLSFFAVMASLLLFIFSCGKEKELIPKTPTAASNEEEPGVEKNGYYGYLESGNFYIHSYTNGNKNYTKTIPYHDKWYTNGTGIPFGKDASGAKVGSRMLDFESDENLPTDIGQWFSRWDEREIKFKLFQNQQDLANGGEIYECRSTPDSVSFKITFFSQRNARWEVVIYKEKYFSNETFGDFKAKVSFSYEGKPADPINGSACVKESSDICGGGVVYEVLIFLPPTQTDTKSKI